jgi:hypothetical protein
LGVTFVLESMVLVALRDVMPFKITCSILIIDFCFGGDHTER